MDRQVQLSVEQFIERMHGDFEQAMRQVAEAVNQARDGQWINGSEVQVLEVMSEFRRKAFETAMLIVLSGPRATQPDKILDAVIQATKGAKAMEKAAWSTRSIARPARAATNAGGVASIRRVTVGDRRPNPTARTPTPIPAVY